MSPVAFTVWGGVLLRARFFPYTYEAGTGFSSTKFAKKSSVSWPPPPPPLPLPPPPLALPLAPRGGVRLRGLDDDDDGCGCAPLRLSFRGGDRPLLGAARLLLLVLVLAAG